MVDWEDIPPTAEWSAEWRGTIEQCNALLFFVVSPDSLASAVCKRELEHAASLHKRMVPILARDTDDAALPEAASPPDARWSGPARTTTSTPRRRRSPPPWTSTRPG